MSTDLIRGVLASMGLPAHIDWDELIQVGHIEIALATPRYDATKGASLETFLWTRVRSAVLEELRRIDPRTRDQRRQHRAVIEATDRLRNRLLREPRRSEVLAELGWDDALLRKVETDAVEVAGIDPDELLEVAAAQPGPYDIVLKRERAQLVAEAIAQLPPNHRTTLLHWLDGRENTQTALLMNRSAQRVGQLIDGAIERLTNLVGGK